jgi:hypothetical protein
VTPPRLRALRLVLPLLAQLGCAASGPSRPPAPAHPPLVAPLAAPSAEVAPPPPAPPDPAPPDPAPPAPAPPAPPPRLRTLEGCAPHDFCDLRAIAYCASNEKTRLAGLDEIAECLGEPDDPRADPERRDLARHARRQVMLEVAFAAGAVSPAAGERLVRAGILSPADARALAGAPAAVKRLTAGLGAGFRDIAAGSCRLRAHEGGETLFCQGRGPCGGGCGLRYFFRVTVRLEQGRYRLVAQSYEPHDEASGGCGCCM